MRRIIFIMVVTTIIFSNVLAETNDIKKIDLKLKNEEVSIVFIKLKESASVLINQENSSNLFILEYKSDKYLESILKIFDSNPNIYYLKNPLNKKVDNIYINKYKGVIRFRLNNYTLCINNKRKIKDCDFVYQIDLSKEIVIDKNVKAIFYDEDIEEKWLKPLQESWIDNAIVEKTSFTILKLDEENYNILVVPSTNQTN